MLKKKTIIWEINNEPPKNYIWVKEDNKAYEYDYTAQDWVTSTTISVIGEPVILGEDPSQKIA